ncbi:MAG: PAS domain S-box protein, partial [Lentisphaerota bacterium]
MKTLLVEDSASDAELLIHELRHTGYVVEAVRVDTEPDFRTHLTPRVDVILADYSMPQFGAMRALEILKESGLDIPFLIISGSIGEDLAIEAMHKGADDYLLKDRLSRLGQAVAHALRMHCLRREKGAAVEQLRLRSAALQAAANAIIITDSQGLILWANPAFEQLTGYTCQEVAGQNPRFLKSGRQDEPFYRRMWTTISSGQVWRGEVINRRKDGALYHEEMTITPVLNDALAIAHYVAIKQDITERNLIQDKLFQAQKMDSIGTLAGGIAHDFNNLLVAIMGFSELALINLDTPSKARTDILEIKIAGERAASLTRQLTAFSRKQTIEPRVLDLNRLITGMMGMLNRLLGEDIHLNTTFDPKAGWIKADPGQIEQVVMNLAINARDAMQGGGELILSTSNETLSKADVSGWPGAKAGLHACLSVMDRGAGMRKEVLDHIFEPF